MSITLASKIILRHSNRFIDRNVLFAGYLQDNIPIQLKTASSKVHTYLYHYWQYLNIYLNDDVIWSLIATAKDIEVCDTLIFYWSKNKLESKFHLYSLLSKLPLGSNIFVVGENRSGAYNVQSIFSSYLDMKKIDSARHSTLYYGQLEKKPIFHLPFFQNSYQINNSSIIHTLPGVFGYHSLDIGSELLSSTFDNNIKGKVLDIGSGSGVLSILLAKQSTYKKVQLWLCDVHAAALEASKINLKVNGVIGKVFASNIFSNVNGRFDLIISNPPFHEHLKENSNFIVNMINQSIKYLKKGGELRIVTHTRAAHTALLKNTFIKYKILARSGNFRVYSAILL